MPKISGRRFIIYHPTLNTDDMIFCTLADELPKDILSCLTIRLKLPLND